MELVPAIASAYRDRDINCQELCTTSDAALDLDTDVQREMRNTTHSLAQTVVTSWSDTLIVSSADLTNPRQKKMSKQAVRWRLRGSTAIALATTGNQKNRCVPHLVTSD